MQQKQAYFWGLLNQLSPTIVGLITSMVLARLLSPSDYGTLGVLTVFFTIANVLIDSGLSGSLINEKQITKKDCSTISTFNLGIGLLVYLFLFSIAPLLERFYGVANLCRVTRVISIMFIINPLGLIPIALLCKRVDFKSQFYTTIISSVLSSLIAICMALKGFGVYSLVWMQVSRGFFKTLFSCLFCRYVPSFGFSIDSFRRLIPFGAYTTISSVIDSFYENLILSVSGKVLSIQTTGYIRQAKNAEEMMGTAIARTVSNVSFPILSKYKTDTAFFVNEAWSIFRLFLLLFAPLLSLACVFSKWIILIIYGNQWLSSAHFLSVFLVAGIFMVMETLIRSFIKSLGEASSLLKVTVIKRSLGVILIVLAAIIKPNYLVEVYTFCTVFAFLVNAWYYCKLTDIQLKVFLVNSICLLIPSFVYLLLSFVFRENMIALLLVAVIFFTLNYYFTFKKLNISFSSLIQKISKR